MRAHSAHFRGRMSEGHDTFFTALSPLGNVSLFASHCAHGRGQNRRKYGAGTENNLAFQELGKTAKILFSALLIAHWHHCFPMALGRGTSGASDSMKDTLFGQSGKTFRVGRLDDGDALDQSGQNMLFCKPSKSSCLLVAVLYAAIGLFR